MSHINKYNVGDLLYYIRININSDIYTYGKAYKIIKEYDWEMYSHYVLESDCKENCRFNCGELESRFCTKDEFRTKKLERICQ